MIGDDNTFHPDLKPLRDYPREDHVELLDSQQQYGAYLD